MDNFKSKESNAASTGIQSSAGKFAIPFKIDIEPMKRLLIASFDNDPEYEAIEPQLFDDDCNGTGLRVLVYRKDKMVDVYYEQGVKINLETFTIGDGIGLLQETILKHNQFEIDSSGINLHIAFTDKNNNVIEMKIIEGRTSKKRLNFLAPVGNEIKYPRQLFLAYMKEFDFVLRNNTTFYARVGQRQLKPSFFPLSRNGEKVFFARYSNYPVIGTLNPPMQKLLVFDIATAGFAEVDGMHFYLREGKVFRITRTHGNKTVSVDFSDGFPNLFEINENTRYSGNWTYKIDDQIITGGKYLFSREGNSLDIQLKISRNWIPKGIPISFQLFTLVVISFRKWPTTYRWKGKIDFSDEIRPLNGEWVRV